MSKQMNRPVSIYTMPQLLSLSYGGNNIYLQATGCTERIVFIQLPNVGVFDPPWGPLYLTHQASSFLRQI